MADFGAGYASAFVRAPDGLRLHARIYGRAPDRHLPVVCLPGLARNAEDFHDLALALSLDERAPRRVICVDYRGRGLSDSDPDWRNYDIKTETADLVAVLAALGVAEAVFVGTSRGGLITMALAALRPALLEAAVLVDVGPVIEARGLIRIRATLSKLPRPASWDEAADALRRLNDAQFPEFEHERWRKLARGVWREREGKLEPAFDPALLKTLEVLDLEQEPPPLWALFEGLSHVPVLVLRGERSDILSPATLAAMAARHPRLETFEVAGQGHAPVLDGEVGARVIRFIAAAEAGERRGPPEPPAAAAEA